MIPHRITKCPLCDGKFIQEKARAPFQIHEKIIFETFCNEQSLGDRIWHTVIWPKQIVLLNDNMFKIIINENGKTSIYARFNQFITDFPEKIINPDDNKIKELFEYLKLIELFL